VTRPWLTPRRRTLAWLVLVIVGCAAAFAFVYWFTVQTRSGRQLADAAFRGALLTKARVADAVGSTLDVVSVTALLTAVAAIAVVALIRMRRASGLVAIGLLIATNASSRILKVYILPRPDLGLVESTPATLNSLPSGHTTAAFSIGVAALFVVPPSLRSVTATAGIVFSSAVAIATMSAGWHRVADSLASFLLVAGWAAFAGVVLLLAQPDFTPGGPGLEGSRDTGRWWAATAIGLALLAGALVTVLVSDPEIRESLAGPRAAFLAGALTVLSTAAAMTVVTLRVVSRVSDGGNGVGSRSRGRV